MVLFGNFAIAQAPGTVNGSVVDPSGAVIPGALIEIESNGLRRTTVSGGTGLFEFRLLPLGTHRIRVTAAGFQKFERVIVAPAEIRISLSLPESTTSLSVKGNAPNALETSSTARSSVDQGLSSKLPIRNQATGLSEVVSNLAPGVASDGNGFFHPLGEHADTAMSLDNQPINDQQAKIFTNQISVNTIATMDIITGAPPAEYGGKTSLILQVATKSGLGERKPTGSLSAGYGSFGTWSENAAVAFGRQRWGNFLAANSSGGGRFLDTPEFRPIHAKGNSESVFDRIDLQPNDKDSLRLNLTLGRSWFQTPNSFDAEQASQDQRSQIRSINIAPGWMHLIGPAALWSVNPFFRQDEFGYHPSRDPLEDLSVTVSQKRRLNNFGIRSDVSYSRGRHTAKIGVSYWQTRLHESFRLGVTDPAFNSICLDANGEAVTNPKLLDPEHCGPGGYAVNPDLIPGIIQYDLSRGGKLFEFDQRASIKEAAAFAQDTVTFGRLTINGGLRFDRYRGLTNGNLLQPRFGVAYRVAQTVFRLSYARLFETPYNENLILANGTGSARNPFGTFRTTPVETGKRNQFNAGIAQKIGTRLLVDADYFWKFTRNAYDFSSLFNSPITFPILWRKSKIDGAAIRVSLAPVHGIAVDTTMGHVRSRFFGPQTGGLIFTSQPSSGVFRIDHAEEFQQTTHVRFQPKKDSPWIVLTWRYNSGLALPGVAPDYQSALQFTGDEQAQMGLYCGNAFASVSRPIRSCAASQFGATRVRIPPPGTQDDDRNPTRVAPRQLFDISAGTENLLRRDSYRVTLHLSAVNIGNKVALYNFLSTFSGTHFVSPRAYQAEIGFVF